MQREMKKLIDDLLDCVDDATDLDEGFVNKTYMAQLMEEVLIPEPPQPITEEALREKGFEKTPTSNGIEYILPGEPDVPAVITWFAKIHGVPYPQIELSGGPDFPGVKTMEDLKALLRFLGTTIK